MQRIPGCERTTSIHPQAVPGVSLSIEAGAEGRSVAVAPGPRLSPTARPDSNRPHGQGQTISYYSESLANYGFRANSLGIVNSFSAGGRSLMRPSDAVVQTLLGSTRILRQVSTFSFNCTFRSPPRTPRPGRSMRSIPGGQTPARKGIASRFSPHGGVSVHSIPCSNSNCNLMYRNRYICCCHLKPAVFQSRRAALKNKYFKLISIG